MPSNLFKGYQGEQVQQVNILPAVAKINEMLLAGADTLGKGIGEAIKAYSEKIDKDHFREAEAGIDNTNPVTKLSSYYIGAPDPTKGVYDQIKTGYDKYVADVKAGNEAASKVKGKITDLVTEEAFYKGSLGMFKNYTATAKNINPDLLKRWNEGLDATGRVLDAQFNGEDGAQIDNTDYERAMASNTGLALGDIKARTPAGNKPKMPSTEDVELKAIPDLIKGWEAKLKSGDYVKPTTTDVAMAGVQKGVFDPTNIYGMKGLASLGKDQGIYGKITPDVAQSIVNDTKGDLGAFPVIGGAILNFAYPFGYKPELTAEEEKNIEDAYNGVKDKALSGKDIWGSGGTQKSPEQAIEDLKKRQAQLTAKKTGIPSDAPSPEVQVANETKALTEHFGEGIKSEDFAFKDAVSTFTAQEKTWNEKRVSMQKYMVEHFGGVPNNFDDYFYTQHPEAALQVVNMGGNRIMINRKTGALTELTQLKGMDSEEMGKWKARQFGAKDENGVVDVEQWGEFVPNSGLETKGEALGTSEKVGDLREKLSQGGGAMQNIDKMLNMMDVDGRSMSPEMIGQSKAIQVALLANLRALFEKGVRITQWSNNVLKDASGNPTDFVSLDALTKPRLEELKDVLAQEMQNAGSAGGIAVRYKPVMSKDSKITESTIQTLERRKGK